MNIHALKRNKKSVQNKEGIILRDMILLALENIHLRGKVEKNVAEAIAKSYLNDMINSLAEGNRWDIPSGISIQVVKVEARGKQIMRKVSPLRNFYYRVLLEQAGKNPIIAKPGLTLQNYISQKLRNNQAFDYPYHEHQEKSFN